MKEDPQLSSISNEKKRKYGEKFTPKNKKIGLLVIGT